MSDFAECRSCGQTIRWGTTRKGKKIPIDPEPCRDGNIRLTLDDKAEILGGRNLSEARSRGDRLHVSHFTTCEQADEWRKG